MIGEPVRPHVLIADDDMALRQLLARYLPQNGLRVSTASDRAQMATIMGDSAIDLIVLNLRLAGEDGLSIARTLRSKLAIPIIMLASARQGADHVVELELGADGYLTMPFSPPELVAQIHTVLRRARAIPAPKLRAADIRAFRFAQFELNLRTRRLSCMDGRRIALTKGEFNLLTALLASPQRVMTRDQLIEATRIYDNEVYDRAIDMQIMRLRRKIEPDPAQPIYIATLRGVGYLFEPVVETVY
jgi:two-component system OmpR family response regulator